MRCHRNRGATQKSPRRGSSLRAEGLRATPLRNSPDRQPACAENFTSARRESPRRKCVSYLRTNPKLLALALGGFLCYSENKTMNQKEKFPLFGNF